ncbi:MAG: Rpn family recombination-promoting nuclease/putative transposase [Dysgonamonadaceae bacterium]|jgi:predicted transposase/invertase (TIGR01784 family)|nr:Rpn family recombination-promoting nuclease/putative transposase [Dysgonamonadaceae bacterium]
MKNNVEEALYLNLLTDFGFKRVFANEERKILLISLLNAILGDRETVKDIYYLQTEQLGEKNENRRAVYDIHCKNEREEYLIIEMQIGKQLHFMDRSLYYVTFPIQAQAKKGKWNYALKPVYHIGILDFIHDRDSEYYLNRYSLINEKKFTKISSTLNFITIELPKFRKTIEECDGILDLWVYCFRNLPKMRERPTQLKGDIFDFLFELTDMNRFTTSELDAYRAYRRSSEQYDTVELIAECSLQEGLQEGWKRGREEGLEDGLRKGLQKGKIEGMVEIARNLRKMNFPIADIAEATGFTPEQIKQL